MRRQNTVAALTSVAVLPPDLAERQSYVGEFLLEGFVHVLLEVRGFDVFNDRSLQTHVKIGVPKMVLFTSALRWTQTGARNFRK